eukprot:c15026_g1_i1 orf=185-589(-)
MKEANEPSLLCCVLLLLLSFSASRVCGCSGDFSKTCSNVQIVGTWSLQALCGDGQGGFKTSSLGLDAHITNNNGKLRCSGGGGDFSASCQSISLTSSRTLSADCADTTGNLFHTSVNLDNCVENRNGALRWACI